MFQYKCLNPISQTGLGLFGEEYKQTEDLNNADAVLVRSAKMHDMELPENVKVIARAGARWQRFGVFALISFAKLISKSIPTS